MFIDDDDTKEELPVHISLGANNFSKIKTNIPARIGKTGKPVADLTKFGSMHTLSGQENHSNVSLVRRILQMVSSKSNFSGTHKVGARLIWVARETNHANLHNNKNGNLADLSNLFSKLRRDPACFK